MTLILLTKLGVWKTGFLTLILVDLDNHRPRLMGQFDTLLLDVQPRDTFISQAGYICETSNIPSTRDPIEYHLQQARARGDGFSSLSLETLNCLLKMQARGGPYKGCKREITQTYLHET